MLPSGHQKATAKAYCKSLLMLSIQTGSDNEFFLKEQTRLLINSLTYDVHDAGLVGIAAPKEAAGPQW